MESLSLFLSVIAFVTTWIIPVTLVLSPVAFVAATVDLVLKLRAEARIRRFKEQHREELQRKPTPSPRSTEDYARMRDRLLAVGYREEVHGVFTKPRRPIFSSSSGTDE